MSRYLTYALQSARLAICTSSQAVPGMVPEPPNFEMYDDPYQKMNMAVELAETYAVNVAPATVPEAAGRAAMADVQADLGGCQAAFVAPGCAVIGLATGKVLQLALLVRTSALVAVVCKCRMRTLSCLGSWREAFDVHERKQNRA